MNIPNRKLIETAIRNFITGIGDDPDREGLRETPARVAKMWCDEFPKRRLFQLKTFESRYDELVLVKDIQVISFCEHHILPFFGVAHVAYIPQDRVIGISKLVRIVEYCALKLNIQENLTEEIANFINKEIEPKAVAVIMECQHLCMALRGVQKPGHKTITSCLRGRFMEDASARAELLQLINSAGMRNLV